MASTVTGRLQGASATLADYEYLFRPAERPHKFAAQEVGYVARGPEGFQCAGCRHWFVNPVRQQAVCEIMRRPQEESIQAWNSCRFWNVDQRKFPLLHVL